MGWLIKKISPRKRDQVNDSPKGKSWDSVKGEMYVLSVVDHRWVGCRLVSRKDSERQQIRSVHGRCHGHLRSGGGRDAHAICRLWRLRGNHHYDSRCHAWWSPSDAACRFGERQKDVRSAVLRVK